MDNSEKILKMVSKLIETGVLTSQDVVKSIITSAKFNKEKIANKLDLVTREEFDVLKKIIAKQQKEILNLKKKKSKG
ncbi:accessory factor UbiK family protein [Pelagibacteraceae bacterium]|nr:accessory factor UbiK family protein [Pelagibacteraceae bacterium]